MRKSFLEDGPCPTCGCLFPSTNHRALIANLAAVVEQRNRARRKLKKWRRRQRSA